MRWLLPQRSVPILTSLSDSRQPAATSLTTISLRRGYGRPKGYAKQLFPPDPPASTRPDCWPYAQSRNNPTTSHKSCRRLRAKNDFCWSQARRLQTETQHQTRVIHAPPINSTSSTNAWLPTRIALKQRGCMRSARGISCTARACSQVPDTAGLDRNAP